jgi:hypothetical protein
MGFSAAWFLWASVILFRAYQIPARAVRWFAAIIAFLTIPWSVENIAPDLLVGGFICVGVASLSTASWINSRRLACLAGIIWGAAYLAKAIALPLALLTVITFGLLWYFSFKLNRKNVMRAIALALLAFGLVAAPWITILTAKYGHLTFSTTRTLMHAVDNPQILAATNTPFLGTQFIAPEPGRLTTWEDPSASLEYEWSPFSSLDHFHRQCQLVASSFLKTQITLTSLFPAWLPCVCFVIWIILKHPAPRTLLQQRFGWSLAPPLILNSLYLPQEFMMTEHRYFFSVAPLLLVVLWQLGRIQEGLRFRRLFWAATLSLVVAACARWAALAPASQTASHHACILAEKLHRAGIADGPYAGNALLPRGRTGLFLAFLMNRPWIGDVPNPTAEAYRHSGAKVIVVRRDASVNMELSAANDFQDLDPILFTNKAEAVFTPVKVYRLR